MVPYFEFVCQLFYASRGVIISWLYSMREKDTYGTIDIPGSGESIWRIRKRSLVIFWYARDCSPGTGNDFARTPRKQGSLLEDIAHGKYYKCATSYNNDTQEGVIASDKLRSTRGGEFLEKANSMVTSFGQKDKSTDQGHLFQPTTPYI